MDRARFDALLKELLDAWCDRRAFNSLRSILSCYPMSLALTDEWAEIARALKTVRMLYGDELNELEMDKLVEAQHIAEAIVYR